MPSQQADLVEHFADLSAEASFSALGPQAVEAAKQSIFDTIGVSLGASGLEKSVATVLDLAREAGGRAEATVIASGLSLPAEAAAFVNGAMAHCLDFDDYTDWGHHAASTLVPAAFAVAEKRGGVSGKEMITAVAVGQDIFGRLRRHVEWQQDWNISPVMGVFAGAAAASRVLGLSARETSNAMGIASMSASGTMEVVRGNSDVRGIYAAFSARGAVNAALLASRGVSGLDTLFEGTYGFLNTYFAGKYDREAILDGLGSDFLGAATLYKRWASVSTSHSHIHAVLQLREEHRFDADDVDEIRVYVGDWHQVMCTPLEVRRAPGSALDAKFSLPYLLAVAVDRGEVGVRDFTAERREDPRIRQLASKVVPVPDSDLDWKLEIPAGRVEVTLTDGRCLEKKGSDVPGTRQAPLTWDQLASKFDDCARASALDLPAHELRRIRGLAENLETLDDAVDLIRAIA